MTHCFDSGEAEKYGVYKAILLYNIRFWLQKNKANLQHHHEGFYWTYNSAKAFAELFPYMNKGSIKNWLLELEQKDGVLMSSCYNEHALDKTKWYTIPSEFAVNQQKIPIAPTMPSEPTIAPTVPSIAFTVPSIAPTMPSLYDTDINTDINTDITNGVEEFFEQQEYTPPPMPNSILGELSAYWIQVNPLYKKIATPKVDNPAIRQIAERITGQKMFHLHTELTMKKWKAFCQVVLTNDFYSQKPLKTIANNIQTFLPDIERAENGQYVPKDSFKNISASVQLPPQKVVMDKRQGHYINNGATIRL